MKQSTKSCQEHNSPASWKRSFHDTAFKGTLLAQKFGIQVLTLDLCKCGQERHGVLGIFGESLAIHLLILIL